MASRPLLLPDVPPSPPGGRGGRHAPTARLRRQATARGPVVPKEEEQRRAHIVAPGAVTALLKELAQAPTEPETLPAFHPGQIVGRFELVREESGAGGFGVVCEARDRELGRPWPSRPCGPRSRARPARSGCSARRRPQRGCRTRTSSRCTTWGAASRGPTSSWSCSRGRTLARAGGAGRPLAAGGAPDRGRGRQGRGSRPRARRRPPRPHARQRLPLRRRPGEGARLRDGPCLRPPQGGRRNASLHGAGAGARSAGGRAHRRLRPRGDPPPDALGRASVPRRPRR